MLLADSPRVPSGQIGGLETVHWINSGLQSVENWAVWTQIGAANSELSAQIDPRG